MAKSLKSPGNGKVQNRVADQFPEEADATAKKKAVEKVIIAPLRMRTVMVRIRGTAPYMQLRFSQKAINKMTATQLAGSQSNSKKKREPRDFEEDYQQAFHRFPDGAAGIPASSIRAACISACRMCNFKMTFAKLSIFVEADGYDVVDSVPLIRIHGEPKSTTMPVRNANGSADLRVRPVWEEWHADVRMRFDEDQFSLNDALNLLARAGAQVGIGEGRPDSKNSPGIGFGTFDIDFKDDDSSVAVLS